MNELKWPVKLLLTSLESQALDYTYLLSDLLWKLNSDVVNLGEKHHGDAAFDRLKLELADCGASIAMPPKKLFGRLVFWKFSPYWLTKPLLSPESVELIRSEMPRSAVESLERAQKLDRKIRDSLNLTSTDELPDNTNC